MDQVLISFAWTEDKAKKLLSDLNTYVAKTNSLNSVSKADELKPHIQKLLEQTGITNALNEKVSNELKNAFINDIEYYFWKKIS